MYLVIDKSNVISYLLSNDEDAIFECNRLIKQGIHLCFNFRKEDIDPQSQEGVKILTWLKILTTGRKYQKNNLHEWNPLFDSANLKSNFASTLDGSQKRYAFLLDNSEVIPKIKEKGAILIGSVGQEIELLLSIRLEETETATHKINSWLEYCPPLPLTDLIICDNHFFKNKIVYERNRDELIKGIVQLPKQSPVNCVIIVKIDEVDKEFILSDEAKKIKNTLKEITGSTKSSVTIIGTYATHDRNAIANYYRLTNGSCFHLNENGLKKDVTAEIKTHAKKSYEDRTNELILIYQRIIDESKGKNIYGDKKSNLLNFFQLMQNETKTGL